MDNNTFEQLGIAELPLMHLSFKEGQEVCIAVITGKLKQPVSGASWIK